MKQRLLPIGYASLLLGLVFNRLFFGHSIGLNFFVYVLLLLAVTAGFMVRWQRPFSRARLGLSAAAVFFSATVFVRSSGFIQFLDVITVFYLLCMIGLLVWRPQARLSDFTGDDYVRQTVRLPFLGLAESGRLLRRAAGYNFQSSHAAKRNMLPVIRGILISLPILAVFLLLFTSADLVFKQYVTSLFSFHVAPTLVGHTLLILFVATFFAGLYALLFTRLPTNDQATTNRRIKLGSIEATIILGSVVTLFFVFVVIQLNYLFGGRNNITVSGGYTYAEYARKGFFELILVAVIVFGLLLLLHTATIRRTIKQHFIFAALCTGLVVEVCVIMLSAHYRLSLYEQAYGFTELRLLSHLFIGWLVVITGLLLAYIVRDQSQRLFARSLFIAAVAFLGIINLINVDAFVARENIQRFHNTGKLDVAYLGTLSADATPALSTLLDSSNLQVRKSIAYQLYTQDINDRHADHSWQAFNASWHRAERILHAHQEQLVANKAYPYLPPQ